MFTHSMSFDLGEDINALRDMVHRWAQERVKPMAGRSTLITRFHQSFGLKWARWACMAYCG